MADRRGPAATPFSRGPVQQLADRTAGSHRIALARVAVCLRTHSATAHTSHLLDATVQFFTEMVIIEISSPAMCRLPNTALFDVPQLHLD